MYFYLFSVFVAWLTWRIYLKIKRWQKRRHTVAHINYLPQNHWFFGLVGQVFSLDDVIRLDLEYINSTAVEWFTAWMFFFYPALNPVSPKTLKPFLSATNVPKNTDFEGAYRMLRPWIGEGLLVSNGKKWERNRRFLTPAFHFDVLKPYVTVFNNVADIFLTVINNKTKESPSINIYPMVSRATLDTMLRCTLAYNDDTIQTTEKHEYVVATQRLGSLVINRLMKPWMFFDCIYKGTKEGREFKQLCDYVQDFSETIIETRRSKLAEDSSQLQKRHLDFLDILITARDEHGQGLSNIEIRDEVDTFMFEGHDTTASAISWSIYALAKYPDMQERVREEVEQLLNGRKQLDVDDLSKLSYTTCFIKESLRMYTPVPAISRKTVEPLTVEGITFLPGQVVDIIPHLVHHNPQVWEDHMEFLPERFFPENIHRKDPFAFIPFSAGQRNCIGQHFAMNEIKIVLSKVVNRFHIHLDPSREAIPYPDLIMRPKDGIYLQFTDRVE